MTRIDKKMEEMRVLRLLYSEQMFPELVNSERPDFTVQGDQPFGVEITEFFVDQTSARLQKMSRYASRIINNEYIHKDDVRKVEVVRFKVYDRTGKRKKISSSQGVMQQNIPITDRIALLVKEINKKSQLFHEYDKSLQHIDLVIYEQRGAFLDGVSDTFVMQTFWNMRHGNLLKSGFRNVYLLVSRNGGKTIDTFQLK